MDLMQFAGSHMRVGTDGGIAATLRNAVNGKNAVAVGKTASKNSTAKPAPALTPMMFGAARALFKTFCKSTPETASAAPESTAARARGRRT